ncbi:hypothetical protein DY000_02053599 [Brassica cretica]|uniref:DUF1985 domain-containing protein n=1 Tax=Brassica cretica TaxID=69181 RepID=A0ABQ7AH04_BRACR|nr:hypothetical protein DY000_02053599 [Brassica cretica]
MKVVCNLSYSVVLTAGNLSYFVVLTADLKPRLVELHRRSVTTGVVGDHIFFDCRKMDLPALLQRMYTLGEKPPALRRALNADEYEELKESKLGVFIKYKGLNFGWASRLFEHLTGLNCDYIEDPKNPRVEVTKEMAAFWEMMGVDVDAGPTTEHIKAAFGRCEEWSREDRMRLGYLAIFTGFIEGRKYSTATRASLARLVKDLKRFENYPWGPSPLLLAYNGGKGRNFFKEAISRQTSVISFVHKDYVEMFPRWDFDVEDPAAENIIKVMFNAKTNWKWTMDCWEVTGTNPRVKKEVSAAETESGVKEESATPRKKARKEVRREATKVPSTSIGGMTKEHIEKASGT